jgi:hypothetical protein
MINFEEYSKDRVIEEIQKCKADPAYYIETYCKISHPIRGYIPFTLFDFQKSFVKQLNENRFISILKSRQLGMSTINAAYALWLASFFTGKKILVIANKGAVATNFITTVQDILGQLPSWLSPKTRVNNRQSIEFVNSSKIKASSTTKDAGKSEAVSLLIFDEAAIIPNAKEVWTAASPTIATGGKAVIISTPKGVGNWFHEIHTKAEQGLNEFIAIKIPWQLHPDRDEKWKETEIMKMGEQMFAQEYDCSFLKSGNTVVNAEVLLSYKSEGHIKDPINKTNFDNGMWIWKFPEYDKHYIVSADVARGDGADYSAIQVFCVETMEQCAEYKGFLPTDSFGHLLVETAVKYNKALLVCENNSIGWSTITKILELNYDNLYWSSKSPIYMDPLTVGQQGHGKVPGINTGPGIRPLLINKLEEYIRTKSVIIHSTRLLDELMTFIYDDSSRDPRAMSGYNDDLVMATAICFFIHSTSLRLMENTSKFYKTMPKLFDKDKSFLNVTTSPAIYKERALNSYKAEGQDITWLI